MRAVLIALAVLAGLFSLIRHFPLAWAGVALPEGVAELSGTIWDGQAADVPLLGTLQVQSSLQGVQLRTPPGDVTFAGTISPRGVRDLSLSMPVAQLPMSDARLAGLDGRVSLRVDEAKIRDDQCISASGSAATNVLAANRARFDWVGPDLSGPIDCVEGKLRVRLTGQSDQETVSATIVTGLDGVYQSDISVQTRDTAAQNALVLFGFADDGSGTYRLSEQGRWR